MFVKKGDRNMSHHILLVEDDISIQEMVETYLVKKVFKLQSHLMEKKELTHF